MSRVDTAEFAAWFQARGPRSDPSEADRKMWRRSLPKHVDRQQHPDFNGRDYKAVHVHDADLLQAMKPEGIKVEDLLVHVTEAGTDVHTEDKVEVVTLALRDMEARGVVKQAGTGTWIRT